MAFSDLTFLFVFLPLALLLYHLAPAGKPPRAGRALSPRDPEPPTREPISSVTEPCVRVAGKPPRAGRDSTMLVKNLVLAFTGLLFYAWSAPVYAPLLLVLFAAHYAAGLLIGRAGDDRRKKTLWLVLIASLDIGCLAFFRGAPLFGMELPAPLGVSFFLFQALTYPVGVWRGECAVQKNVVDLAAYAFFFPKLLAGPVIPCAGMEQPLAGRAVTLDKAADGAGLFLQGLAKKVLLADSLFPIWEAVRTAGPASLPALTAWLGLLAFAFGLYFDLSGYADMAVGLGRLFGFELPRNMEHPYRAKSIQGFWLRWQSTVTGWFGNMVCRPLAGKRDGKLRSALAIAVTGTAFGLWHGFTWNFLLWGLYLAGLVLLERLVWGRFLERLPEFFRWLATFLLVLLGWCLFFTDSPMDAGRWFAALFGANGVSLASQGALYLLHSNLLLYLAAFLGASVLPVRLADRFRQRFPNGFQLLAGLVRLALFAAALCGLAAGGSQPFFYFRF